MRRTKYAARLSKAERAQLQTLVGHGVAPARRLTHARILLKADQGEGGAAWADVHYPAAEKIVLVMDQLNTHSPASLYEAFAADEAKRLADRLEIHYTPKHGSWLNMAEIELGILQRQCLDRRLGDRATVEREVAAWVRERNRATRSITWRFTTADARIKLKCLYPAHDD